MIASPTEIIEQLPSYISSISIEIEEVTRNFRFMHFAMYIYEVAW